MRSELTEHCVKTSLQWSISLILPFFSNYTNLTYFLVDILYVANIPTVGVTHN